MWLFSLFSQDPIFAIFSVVAIIIAITVHEFAHAWTADRLGDPTPRLQGRITLNPTAHLDPIGTLLILFIGLGWGKPVLFDPFNLRNPRKDAALISFAGPASNILLAILISILYRIVIATSIPTFGIYVNNFLQILSFMVFMNVTLAVFNLIPIHPLDGFKVVGGLLPEKSAHQWYELQSYGYIFLLLLLLPIFNGSPIQTLITIPREIILRLLLPLPIAV